METARRQKTAVRVLEATSFSMENVHINLSGAGGDGSIGLLLYGREASVVRNVRISAQWPIVVALSPFEGQSTGLDHWAFMDIFLHSESTQYPLVEVEDGCNLSSVINCQIAEKQPSIGFPYGDGYAVPYDTLRV